MHPTDSHSSITLSETIPKYLSLFNFSSTYGITYLHIHIGSSQSKRLIDCSRYCACMIFRLTICDWNTNYPSMLAHWNSILKRWKFNIEQYRALLLCFLWIVIAGTPLAPFDSTHNCWLSSCALKKTIPTNTIPIGTFAAHIICHCCTLGPLNIAIVYVYI